MIFKHFSGSKYKDKAHPCPRTDYIIYSQIFRNKSCNNIYTKIHPIPLKPMNFIICCNKFFNLPSLQLFQKYLHAFYSRFILSKMPEVLLVYPIHVLFPDQYLIYKFLHLLKEDNYTMELRTFHYL